MALSDDPARPPDPPSLLSYVTWSDEQGYYARYQETLTEQDLEAGCLQQVHAATPHELTVAAVRNRVRIMCRRSGQEADRLEQEAALRRAAAQAEDAAATAAAAQSPPVLWMPDAYQAGEPS